MAMTATSVTALGSQPTADLSALTTAQDLLAIGIHSVPIPLGQKSVTRYGWERERYGAADLERVFGVPTNIGILLGTASNGFADCDLDTDEAIRAGAWFLPATGMVWGRDGKPRSHYGYFIDIGDAVKNLSFKDVLASRNGHKANTPGRNMLCELRLRGQTVGPGSVHPSGERVRYDSVGKPSPATISYELLKQAIGRVAAVSHLSRYWVEGIRHEAALPFAGMMCRGGMDVNEAVRVMRAVCTLAGEDDTDIENRIACVVDTYKRAEAGDHFTAGPTLEEFIDPRLVTRLREWLTLTKQAYGGDLGPDGFPLSDIGNAERCVQAWKGQVLYCDDESSWYIYTGKIWERDRNRSIYRRTMEVVSAFRGISGANTLNNKGNTTPDQWRRHAEKMGSIRQIRAMQELATASLAILPEDFDADPLQLNLPNGTLELNVTTGAVYLREHRPDDYHTMLWPAPYIAGATHPLFDGYLERFFPEDDRRGFLQEMAGYALTGLPKRYSLQLIGPTHTGKSMTLKMFGDGSGSYGGTLKYESLMRNPHKGGDTPRADLWRVRRKRFITVSEIPPGTALDVALFKSLLSGGDKIAVRNIFDRTGGTDTTFAFSLWTSGNQPYGPPPGDEAAYERMLVLRCEHQVPKEDRNDDVQLQATNPDTTGSAALAFAVEGFKRLYGEKGGRVIGPEVVIAETKAMQNALDPWSQVIDELFNVTGDAHDGVLKQEAWTYALSVYETNGGRVRSVSKEQWNFETALERRGARQMKSKIRWNNRASWTGIKWLDGNLRVTPPDWS